MKKIIIGIFAISIAFVSCNKEEIAPITNNKVNDKLIEANVEFNGGVGNWYRTTNGIDYISIHTPNYNKAVNYSLTPHNNAAGNFDGCVNPGSTCGSATIGGSDVWINKKKKDTSM